MLGFSAIGQTALADIPLLTVTPPPPVTPAFIAGGGATAGGGHQRRREHSEVLEGELLTKARNQTIRALDKHDAAVRLGKLGGLKGGQARASSLSGRARSEAARSAAHKRWDK